MKFNNPKIKKCNNKTFEECIKDNEYYNAIFVEKPKFDLKYITFDSCIFENIDFTSIKLIEVCLIDVIFKNCDLSNQEFDKQMLSRVKFENCKLVGTSFIDSSLRDIEFLNCNT